MNPVRDLQFSDDRLVALYDTINAADHDRRFYEARIGPAPQRVADVGCGTGAFAVRLAAAGHTVLAADPAPSMLAHARRRPGGSNVTWIEGDAGDLPRAPGLDCATMTGHAFQCLLTDDAVARMLRAVRERLRPGGRLMFESRNPATRPWLEWHGHELVSVRPQFVTFDTRFQVGGEELINRSTLRFLAHAQIAQRLREAGFSEVEWYGGWNGEPYDEETSPEIIVVARSEGRGALLP
jgi:ubiquinone/menaquinone biosynthesis C-methylase UbiE